MAGFDLTAANAILKENYNDDLLADLVPKSHPLLYFLPKHPDFTGSLYIQPVKYGNPQAIISGSTGFASLISNPSSSTVSRFALTTTKHYGLVQIDRETILATSNDEGAFVSALDFEVGNAVSEMGRDLARQAFGSGTGTLGVVSTIALGVIVLVDPTDAVNFEVGMRLDSYTAETGGTLEDAGMVVTAVNEDSGEITVSGSATTSPGDFLFRQDSRGNEWAGLSAWIPDAAPGPLDSFFSVNRSVSNRLYGQRLDASSMSLIDALHAGAMKIEKQGGSCSHIFCSFEQYGAIANAEQTQKRYPQPSAEEAKLGFAGIEVITPYGRAMVYPDRYCPSEKIYMLSMDSWKLVSRENLVHWVNEDGTMILRTSSDDSFQGRIASYSNMLCRNPIANLVLLNVPPPPPLG